MWNAGFLSFVLAVAFAQIGQGRDNDFPFRNVSLTWDQRVDDLVSRLTIADIMFQMAKGGAGTHGGPAPAIPRLGIEPWAWNTECLRGDSAAGEATGFPQAIGLAAAFNPSLIYEIAEATGVEVRAKHNDYVKKKQFGDHKGLSCFSPVINIMRHPLWGRNQETYGEDPYLTGVYAAHYVIGLQGNHPRYIRANAGCKHFDAYAGPENYPQSRLAFDAEETYGEDPYLSGVLARQFVKGLQGNDPRYVRASAGCKHFNVHGGPENVPVSRFSFNSKVSDFDWRTTFLPAFRQCVLAGSYSLMCSFNDLNGIPACANHDLLTKVLRAEWKFEGYVISDEVALEFIITQHKYLNNTLDAAVACVKAGCNIELSGNNPAVYLRIEDAVKKGLLDEILVRERVKPLFYTRMRLGEFDPPSMNPYMNYNLSMVQSPEHRKLAVKAAMQTFALLKNKNLLPIKKTFDKIAIVGPMADNVQQLYGDYAADVDPKYVKTPREGLKGLADTVEYAAGCKDNKCRDYHPEDIKLALLSSKLTVICVGTGMYDIKYVKTPREGLKGLADTVEYAAGCKDNKCRDYHPEDIKLALLSSKLTVICVGTGMYDIKYVKTPREGLKGLADTVEYAAGCKDNKCRDYHPEDIKLALLSSKLTVICVGTGMYDIKYVKTPREGLKGLADTVEYAAGCKDNKCRDYHPEDIKLAVLGSKLTFICVGTGQELEAEGNDRHSMDLPANQTQLVKDAIAYSSGSPVVLLVFSAGPVNISFADRSDHVDVIMQCFFPAQATGEALFNTLTMATSDSCPGGRLPYTWYDTADQVPSIVDYSMEGKTYRYFTGTPLYPFGYGLSYTTFEYSDLTFRKSILAGDDQYIFAIVQNTGTVDAYEVVQVYMSWKTTGQRMPKIQLVGFERLFLTAKSTQSFKFTITSEQMAVWTDSGWVVQTGTMEIHVGGQQPNQEKNVGSNILRGTFAITGETNLGKY